VSKTAALISPELPTRWLSKEHTVADGVSLIYISMHLGRAKSFVLVVLWIPPTLIVNMIKALGHRCHKRILLEWLRIISTQLGKLGYFLGFISREYLPKKAL
jgi:hypothetical protein